MEEKAQIFEGKIAWCVMQTDIFWHIQTDNLLANQRWDTEWIYSNNTLREEISSL